MTTRTRLHALAEEVSEGKEGIHATYLDHDERALNAALDTGNGLALGDDILLGD
jgi:hypothetical protein